MAHNSLVQDFQDEGSPIPASLEGDKPFQVVERVAVCPCFLHLARMLVGKEEGRSSGERVAFHLEVRRVVDLPVGGMGLSISLHIDENLI